MSGGVDSSVAAFLIKEKGFDCIGATMKLFHNEDIGLSRGHTCCSLEDVEDARDVCYKLGIDHFVFNFSDRFRETVVEPFIKSYENGITPNPCIECNRYLKFEKLIRRAKELGIDYVVTGHYARIVFDEKTEKFMLKKALDPTKDQSYVLYSMTQEQLSHTLFPLGEYSKTETRKIAADQGFLNAQKHDSQDICFIPNGDRIAFMERYTGRSCPKGSFTDLQGNILGRHKGIIHYTVGQHKKLGIGFDKPMYVCSIFPESNTVVLGEEKDLYSSEAVVCDFNWISGEAPKEPFRCKAKVRYRQPEQPATVVPLDEGKVKIIFDEPQRAITPGQAAVLYDEETVLGGGTVAR
ncbi:MAG: tRNA 2-thiouridine(34) synthase MnmA [Oscillospiraceae bacterium]|nr:tRNA 2-thiouridine(34) synthase MnmA [Oscillospiraceae bacterium]